MDKEDAIYLYIHIYYIFFMNIYTSSLYIYIYVFFINIHIYNGIFSQFSSVAQSYPTLCDPMNHINPITNDEWNLSSPSKDQVWIIDMGALSPGSKIARELLTPVGSNYWELPWRPTPVYKTCYHSTANDIHCRTLYQKNKQDKHTHTHTHTIISR